MIKLLFSVVRKPGMSREGFRRHVTEVHGPLVVNTREVSAPIRRYVQHLPMHGKTDTAFGLPVAAERDIVVEMLQESFEAMIASLQTPQYFETIQPDEDRMGDRSTMMMLFVREVEIIEGASWPVTLYHFLKRRSDLSRKDFQERWLEQQKGLITGESARKELRRYVQNRVLAADSLPMGTDDRGPDVVDEYHFEDLDAMTRLGADSVLAKEIVAGRNALTDPAHSFAVLTQGITFIERL